MIVQRMCEKWAGNQGYIIEEGNHPHEASYLKLDCSKAKMQLNWSPRWHLDETLDNIIEWTKAYKNGTDLKSISFSQIQNYQNK